MIYLLAPLPLFALAAALLWRRLARRGYVTVWPVDVEPDNGEYTNDNLH